jgi:hypothetical protein
MMAIKITLKYRYIRLFHATLDATIDLRYTSVNHGFSAAKQARKVFLDKLGVIGSSPITPKSAEPLTGMVSGFFCLVWRNHSSQQQPL